MRTENLPSIKELYRAIENAATDLYGFGVICQSGITWVAEPDLLDTLLLGLENFWFTENDSGLLSHDEFREEFFKAVWEKGKGRKHAPEKGADVPIGHQEMSFYHLGQVSRAAIYLRTKKQMPYSSIALILGSNESQVRTEIEKAREYLLGRSLRDFEWSEEEF
ncbi:MAG: hypothetical protein ACXWQO_06125 [Bdellovibrionota bacterium]